MTDYNDGNWHGWNGGECPVHPDTIVEAVWVGDSSPNHFFKDAGMVSWDDTDGNSICAFRVTKQYVEPPKPREFWLAVNDGTLNVIDIKTSRPSDMYGYFHVREVIE